MTGRLAVRDLPLPGLKRVERQRLGDHRGFLSRLFCAETLEAAGWRKPLAQINQTLTRERGTVRGLHYQKPPAAEIKLVMCLKGAIWDVAVDVRRGSSTFLHHHGEILSEENGYALLIPEGFAHGFQALTADVELLYCHSAPHAPDLEAGLNVADPRLALPWPLPVTGLSVRDAGQALLTPDFEGVVL
ncbi:dTDP-4-dehydrorhamnose 3,5-epimerase family protein [Pararhodospirillum photometricum]|uniref:dTDP-4-dehydrorhamnose 3,5-epimerase n=1 Tax=Pararhodospirillum photometricum DSM 122 TaxID=1150469 RepID=H6SSC3_PARPM|nr:dTDP-4-dehydrorhamnose 3,5-epimerase family protein [Pararhodospirillum photometricum]CCG07802.1 dTDP-4-dehydrorhamnose 3,5-epimerase, putative [Pararhodospirillum photometricum DSM 122]